MDEGLAWQWIKWILSWHCLLFVKCFFNWGSSFWLTSFWRCSLEFLSIITTSVNWWTVFNLEIQTWLLLYTKLSSYLILWKIWFLVTALLWRFCLDLHIHFAIVYLLYFFFSKKVFKRNYLFSFERLIIL